MVGGRSQQALVSQLAEETDSKPVQCEFESHRGHSKRTSTVPAIRVLQIVDHGTCAKIPANRAAKKATPAVINVDTIAVVT
jgi:hypothetical protein